MLSRCRSMSVAAVSRLSVASAAACGPIESRHREKRATATRRTFLFVPALVMGTDIVWRSLPTVAFTIPPPGFGYYRDVLDGYEFFVKDDWLPVTSTGNDVAYRSLRHPEQNLFVNISSPSSSRFASVKDIGTAEEAGNAILQQYLTEFMSTRIGVLRQGEFISGAERQTPDGKIYYDIEVILRSYASRSQLAVTEQERQRSMELEWERRLLTVIGVANKRKYEFRLQSDRNAAASDTETLQFMAQSFRCYDVTA